MRVVAIYDIHGNLPALEAVIEDIRRAEVDRVVVGGDVVPGPMPRETLMRLLELDLPVQFIQGNGEREVLAQMAGQELTTVPKQFQGLVRWTAEQLRPEDQRLVARWPKALRLEIPGMGSALFCHATPRNDVDVFTRLTPQERLRPFFEGLGVSLVVCGHTHMQFDRMIGNVRVVNAGSVGMPFGEAGAYWLLLGPGVELRRTVYDLAQAAERVRQTNYPEAEQFATRNILQPSSEREMLELYARVELK